MFDNIFLTSILVIQTFLLVLYFILLIKHKMRLSKANRYYLVPSSLIVFSLYLYAYIKSGTFVFLNIFDSLNATLKIFVLDVKTSLVQPIINDNKLYFVCLLFAIICAAYAMYSSIVLFVVDTIKNRIKIKKVFNKEYNDIVLIKNFSCLNKTINYLNNNKNTIVWINDKLNKEEYEKVSAKNIKFINNIFNVKSAKSVLKKTNKINIIVFNTFDLHDLFNIINTLNKEKVLKDNKLSFYLECDNKIIEYVKDYYINASNLQAFVKVFSKHELIARELNINYPLSSLIKREDIEDLLTINKDIDINTFIFGFGKMGEELFKMNVSNNQFCMIDNGKYKAKQINYYIYDQNDKVLDSDYLERCETYKKFYNEQEYFEKAEDICNISINSKYICEKILSDDFIKYIKDKSNNFIYLCLDNDDLNIKLASKIKLYLNSLNLDFNYKIFVRIENNNALLKCDKDFIYFGNEKNIFSHNIIVNDALSNIAIRLNNHYNRKNNKSVDWNSLSYIKQYSNIYSAINFNFKLGLMNLKAINEGEGIDKDTYYQIYANGKQDFNYDNYEDYFKLSKRNTIAYVEHLRWTAFYILNGFLPMKKKECINDKGNLISKNEVLKLHSCITSTYGLDEVHKHYANIMSKDIKDVETYNYDYRQADNMYSDLNDIGYKIVEIK